MYRRHTEPWMYTFSMQKMHNFQPANSVVEAEPRLVISPSLPKAMTQRGHAQTTLMSGNRFRDDPRPAAIWGAASPLNKALVAMHLQLTTLPAVNCDRVDMKKRLVCRQTGEARLSLPSLNNEVMEWKLRPIEEVERHAGPNARPMVAVKPLIGVMKVDVELEPEEESDRRGVGREKCDL